MIKMNFLSLKYIFILSILATSVTSCSKMDKFHNLRDSENGGVFLIHLSNLYEKLSKAQAAKADWTDSALFSEKSLRASKGILADPEHPEDWDVRETVLPELKSARRVLLDNVNGEAIRQKPRIAASAYFMYDCWIEQEENWWIKYIDTCKREFYSTINMLNSVVKDVSQKAGSLSVENMVDKASIGAVADMSKKVTEAAPEDKEGKTADEISSDKKISNKEVPVKEKITEADIVKEVMADMPEIKDEEIKKPTSIAENEEPEIKGNVAFTLYFSLDSHEISGETMLKLQDIAHQITEMKPELVTINGHTDRSGKESYNLNLSKKRANTVYKALIEYGEMGIEKNEFEILGFGESYPARKTEDGIKDPANRRVEIILE